MSAFVDSSVLYGAVDDDDAYVARARAVLESESRLLTSDHVVAETWRLLRDRIGWEVAERFWAGIRAGAAKIEPVLERDLDVAWEIGRAFDDQAFSFVDRTSFALMERLGITRVASFDDDFAVYRFGPRRERAFELVR